MAAPILVVHSAHAEAHEVPDGHPDSPARLEAVGRGITAAATLHPIAETTGRLASAADLESVHSPEHVRRIHDLGAAGGGYLDDDETYVGPSTFVAARGAAGAGLTAAERLAAGAAPSAFVVTRPAGHHATATQASGFCVFNNVAVTAARLAAGGARVSIVDWDAHHGNGTQDLFWTDDRVQYVSIHQEAIYPGSGRPHERGPAPGSLTTVNLDLPAGATGDHHLALVERIVEPEVRRFAPDWILVSCGFDAHEADPLAGLALVADDFAILTSRMIDLAPRHGRVILFLEGGYDLAALEEGTTAVLRALAGEASWCSSAGGPGAGRVGELCRLWGVDET